MLPTGRGRELSIRATEEVSLRLPDCLLISLWQERQERKGERLGRLADGHSELKEAGRLKAAV